jgi:enterochelin esterase-like enzyme
MLAGLDVISAQFVIACWFVVALLVAGLGLWLWTRRHRSRGWLRALLAMSGCVVVLVAASAVSVNAYYAYLPTVGDAVEAATGDRQWVPADAMSHLSSARQRRADRVGLTVRLPIPGSAGDGFVTSTSVVYLPPQYFTDPAARFPVVYLFHGSPGQPSDWFHAGEAAREGQQVASLGRPAIVVAPRMSRSWTDDPECVDGSREKVETHLIRDVIPTVDSTLRTEPTRDGRIFAGMSAGGFCALNLGLRNRVIVSTIIDMSGDTTPTHTGGAAVLFGRNDPDAAAQVEANNPASYSAALPTDLPMRIWLDSGTADTDIVHQMSALSRALAPKVQQLVWRVRPGGHTYWVWTQAMHEALPWALGAAAPSGPSRRSRPGP